VTLATSSSVHPLAEPFLCIITDEALDAAALSCAVDLACVERPAMVQLRARMLCGGPMLRLAVRLRAATRAHGCDLVVHDRIDVALAADADGLHLPAAGMASARARALVGRERRLGRSVHSIEEIDREKAIGAVDYLQFGPVFETPSKAAYGPPQGLATLEVAVRRAEPIPLVAVGGIATRNAARIIDAGACGIAVISAVMRAADPRAAVRELHDTIRHGRERHG
jgi:thiamine-phosphate pyrophosphorylase